MTYCDRLREMIEDFKVYLDIEKAKEKEDKTDKQIKINIQVLENNINILQGCIDENVRLGNENIEI